MLFISAQVSSGKFLIKFSAKLLRFWWKEQWKSSFVNDVENRGNFARHANKATHKWQQKCHWIPRHWEGAFLFLFRSLCVSIIILLFFSLHFIFWHKSLSFCAGATNENKSWMGKEENTRWRRRKKAEKEWNTHLITIFHMKSAMKSLTFVVEI